jgi:hypothetical protein
MYQHIKATKPFLISISVGISIILLFSIDKPNFNWKAQDERTILPILK